MSVSLSPLFNGYQSFLASGLPNAGGSIYTYAAGTTTPQTTYTTSAGSIANSNPIVLSADGRPPQEIWLTDSIAYKFLVNDAFGVALPNGPYDNITGFVSANITGPNGSAAIGGNAQIVASITALRALLATSASKNALVTGYYAAGDGGGGVYYYDSTDTTSPDNGGTIIVASDGGRWKMVRMGAVSVKSFGAKLDGTTNDAAAYQNCLNAMSGKVIYHPAGTAIIGTSLTWPSDTKIIGDGRSVSLIKKGFNGDLFLSVGGYASAQDIRLEGAGATYTGRVLYVSSYPTPCITFTRCDIINGATNSIEFVANGGASSRFEECDIFAYDLTKPAVQFPDDAAGGFAGLNRRFISINTGGGILADLNGSDDTFIIDSFFRGLQFSKAAGCGLLWCTGNRFATLGATQTFNGAGMVIANNNLAGAAIITSNSTGVFWENNSAASVTWQPSANTYGSVSHSKQNFTSVWGQASGTGPTLGNATLNCEYSRQGMTANVNLYFIYGSTSTGGDGTAGWTFSLPFRASQAIAGQVIPALMQDASGNLTPVLMTIGSGLAYCQFVAVQSVRAGYPFVWAAGASIRICFTYAVDA